MKNTSVLQANLNSPHFSIATICSILKHCCRNSRFLYDAAVVEDWLLRRIRIEVYWSESDLLRRGRVLTNWVSFQLLLVGEIFQFTWRIKPYLLNLLYCRTHLKLTVLSWCLTCIEEFLLLKQMLLLLDEAILWLLSWVSTLVKFRLFIRSNFSGAWFLDLWILINLVIAKFNCLLSLNGVSSLLLMLVSNFNLLDSLFQLLFLFIFSVRGINVQKLPKDNGHLRVSLTISTAFKVRCKSHICTGLSILGKSALVVAGWSSLKNLLRRQSFLIKLLK